MLLLIGLFMIPISGLLLDPSPTPNYLDTPMEELNNYSLRQVYGESLYLDEDIQPLNNHTLREVFEGGQLLNITSFTISTNGSFQTQLSPSISILNGDILYFTYNQLDTFISNDRNTVRLLGTTSQYYSLTTNFRLNSGIYSHQMTANENKSIIFHWTNNANPTPIRYTNYFAINQTSLGISALTVTQMDYWFQLYEDIKVSNVRSNAIEYGIYSRDSFVQNMNRFGLENTSLAKLNYYYDLYQYYISFELD